MTDESLNSTSQPDSDAPSPPDRPPTLLPRVLQRVDALARVFQSWDDASVAPPFSEDGVSQQTAQTTEQESPAAQSGHWWLFFLLLIGAVVLIVAVPQPYAMIVLVTLLVGGLLVVARDAELTPRTVLSNVVNLARRSRELNHRAPEYVATHRHRLTVSTAILAFVLIGLSAVGFRPANGRSAVDEAAILMLLSGLALGASLLISRQHEPLMQPTSAPLSPARANGSVTALGVIALLLLAEINGRVFALPALERVSSHVQFALLVAGIALITWGLSGTPRLSVHFSDWSRVRWLEVLAVAAIFVLALGLRLWELNTSIRGSVDEGTAIDGIFHIWSGRAGLVTPASSYTLLYPYWQAGIVSIVGHSLAGLRATSAIVGALTTIALYVLARTLFDRKTALAAAFLLATFPPHLHFSRIALLSVADALFGTLALAFLARGFKYNRRLDWALAGVSLGLTQYFFEAGRLLFLPLVVAWVVLMALVQRDHLQTQWRGLVLTVLAALFVAVPVYYAIFALNAPRTIRMNESGLGLAYWEQLFANGLTLDALGQVLWRVSLAFQSYVHLPDATPWYGGDQALILEYLMPLFLLGMFYLIWRARVAAVIVPLWVVATALGNSLLRDIVIYARYIVVLPALALLIAVGIRYALPLVWPGQRRVILALPLLLLLLAIGVAQVGYYFGPHLQRFNTQLRNSKPFRDGIDAILRAVELPPQTDIYFISNPEYDVNVARNFLGFLLDDPTEMTAYSVRPDQFDREFIATLPHYRNYIFFLEPGDRATASLLSEFFALQPPQWSPYDIPDDKEYVLYFAPMS